VDRDWARELGLPNPFGGRRMAVDTGVNFMN